MGNRTTTFRWCAERLPQRCIRHLINPIDFTWAVWSPRKSPRTRRRLHRWQTRRHCSGFSTNGTNQPTTFHKRIETTSDYSGPRGRSFPVTNNDRHQGEYFSSEYGYNDQYFVTRRFEETAFPNKIHPFHSWLTLLPNVWLRSIKQEN